MPYILDLTSLLEIGVWRLNICHRKTSLVMMEWKGRNNIKKTYRNKATLLKDELNTVWLGRSMKCHQRLTVDLTTPMGLLGYWTSVGLLTEARSEVGSLEFYRSARVERVPCRAGNIYAPHGAATLLPIRQRRRLPSVSPWLSKNCSDLCQDRTCTNKLKD